tara:strand:- start:46 stop:687 length:642 start_codon:yes stop_codon:yes gene_type:complete
MSRNPHVIESPDDIPFRGIPNGIFLEAGATNGISQSNTKMYEDVGWRGLLVEPNKKMCEEARRYRPNSIVENYALVSSTHQKETLLGYFDKEDANALEAYAIEENYLYDETSGVGWKQHDTSPVEVPAITLKKLLEKHSLDGSRIDFFSLDVEGCELQVLDGLDLTINRPLYIHIEVSELTRQKYKDYLEGHNYVFLKSIEGAHDDVYRRKEK